MLARMTSKGRITVPVEVRRCLRLGRGSLVSFELKDAGRRVELVPVDDNVMALRGSVRVSGAQPSAAIQREVERRVAGDVASEAQVR